MDTNNQFGREGLIEVNEMRKKGISSQKKIKRKNYRRNRSKGLERQRIRWTDQ
jgi:hypothetical protein